MNTAIRQLHARQILDSRGTPTVEVDCILADGSLGRAAVASGASTGSHEAVELRDNDELRFFGKGVLIAVSNVNNLIAGEIVGMDARGQREVDSAMIALDELPTSLVSAPVPFLVSPLLWPGPLQSPPGSRCSVTLAVCRP